MFIQDILPLKCVLKSNKQWKEKDLFVLPSSNIITRQFKCKEHKLKIYLVYDCAEDSYIISYKSTALFSTLTNTEKRIDSCLLSFVKLNKLNFLSFEYLKRDSKNIWNYKEKKENT